MAETLAEKVESLDLDANDTGQPEPRGAEDRGSEEPKSADKGDASGAGDKPGGTQEDPGRSGGDGAGAGKADDSPGGETDAGYVADEIDEPGEETPPQTPADPNLTPELKYIVDNLPTLSVRGRETDNGPLRTYQVKAAGQLPEDFTFASKREELIFNQALAAQELKAQNLQAKYQQEQAQTQVQRYETQENEDIRHDIGDLQREDLLPKFKYPSTDRRFNSDPAVKQAQEIMDFMNEKNQEYTKAGKLYRISFRDAYELMTPTKAERDKNSAQSKEDKERKEVTRRTAGSSGAPSSGLQKPRIARSMDDLMSRLDTIDF